MNNLNKINISDSYQRYQLNQNNLFNALKKQKSNVFYSYSALWSSLFKERENASSFSSLLRLLDKSNNITTGIASHVSQAKETLFNNYYGNLVSAADIDEHPLGLLGNPTLMDFNGKATNVSYVVNLRLFKDLVHFLKKTGKYKKGINILEIGAGYGGLAAILLKSDIPASYTIIDLPENLSLSNFYLTEQFPHYKSNVLTWEHPISKIESSSLNFVTPGNIEALDGAAFDLVINTDSLGEMPKETSIAYIAWISKHLSDDGCFFSKNGHRRSEDSTMVPSQFGYDQFEMQYLTGFAAPGALWDDHSHMTLLAKKKAKSQAFDNEKFDTICALLALGLANESQQLCDNFVGNRLSSEENRFLTEVEKYFKASDTSKSSVVGDYESIHLKNLAIYLKGLAAFTAGDNTKALELLEPFSKVASTNVSETITLFILAQLKGKEVLNGHFNTGAATDFLAEEVREYMRFNALKSKLAFQMRNDLVRKKITYPNLYKPSAVMNLKNLYFNFKDKKIISTKRY